MRACEWYEQRQEFVQDAEKSDEEVGGGGVGEVWKRERGGDENGHC